MTTDVERLLSVLSEIEPQPRYEDVKEAVNSWLYLRARTVAAERPELTINEIAREIGCDRKRVERVLGYGRQSETWDRVRALLREGESLSAREIANRAECSVTTVYAVIHEMIGDGEPISAQYRPGNFGRQNNWRPSGLDRDELLHLRMTKPEMTIRDLAAHFGYSSSTIIVALSDLRRQGLLPNIHANSARAAALAEQIRERVLENPTATNAQIAQDLGVTAFTVNRHTREMGGKRALAAAAARRSSPTRPHWPDERIIRALVDWTNLYGKPPTGRDWDPAKARKVGNGDQALRYENGDWPSIKTVRAHFGTLANALEAAGITR